MQGKHCQLSYIPSPALTSLHQGPERLSDLSEKHTAYKQSVGAGKSKGRASRVGATLERGLGWQKACQTTTQILTNTDPNEDLSLNSQHQHYIKIQAWHSSPLTPELGAEKWGWGRGAD